MKPDKMTFDTHPNVLTGPGAENLWPYPPEQVAIEINAENVFGESSARRNGKTDHDRAFRFDDIANRKWKLNSSLTAGKIDSVAFDGI